MSLAHLLTLAVAVIGPVLAYVAAEMTRRYAQGRRDGDVETKATALAANFAEFKATVTEALKEFRENARTDAKEIKEELQRLHTRLDGPHYCQQERILGEMSAELKSHWARIDRIDERLHVLEGHPSAVRS